MEYRVGVQNKTQILMYMDELEKWVLVSFFSVKKKSVALIFNFKELTTRKVPISSVEVKRRRSYTGRESYKVSVKE